MNLSIAWNGSPDAILNEGTYLSAAEEEGLVHVAYAGWPITPETRAGDLDLAPIASFAYRDHWTGVYRPPGGALVWLAIEHGGVSIRAAATSPDAAQEGLDYFRERLPREQPNDDTVPVTFWAYNPNGPRSVRRRLNASSWEEIAGNYAAATRSSLDRLMEGFAPGRGGQLILWSGRPGTGKTTAVRALAHAWRTWAEIHYVTDPDRFFGSEADYMLSVLLDTGEHPGLGLDLWRVLLLEDAGELLAADARERTGQGLSRFLNAVDGLIGQGLRVLILVTTNESVRKLNPAVARPGRCAANIEFEPLTREEVLAWLRNRGGDRLVREASRQVIGGGVTLAEIFAEVEGFDGERVSRPLGFAPV